MDTKFMKNVSQKKQAREYDLHISGIAATLFGIFVAIHLVVDIPVRSHLFW